MQYIQWALIALSVTLQLLLLKSLLAGPYKRLPVVFIYTLVLFLTTVADVAGLTSGGQVTASFFRTELVRQVMLYVIVMSLIDGALKGSVVRGQLRFLMAAVAVLAVGISWQIHANESPYALRMTKFGRDLSFVAMILNLVLWTLLILKRDRNRELLMLSGGLGLQFAGEAIGQSLRQLSGPIRSYFLLNTGNFILVGAHIFRLYVWLQAFRVKNTQR